MTDFRPLGPMNYDRQEGRRIVISDPASGEVLDYMRWQDDQTGRDCKAWRIVYSAPRVIEGPSVIALRKVAV